MPFDKDTRRLEAQLRYAISRCAIRRLAGPQEEYVEAFDLVKALQLQRKRHLSKRVDQVTASGAFHRTAKTTSRIVWLSGLAHRRSARIDPH
jgi:hypothetical protein